MMYDETAYFLITLFIYNVLGPLARPNQPVNNILNPGTSCLLTPLPGSLQDPAPVGTTDLGSLARQIFDLNDLV